MNTDRKSMDTLTWYGAEVSGIVLNLASPYQFRKQRKIRVA
jgi:hypothetical protein